MAYTPELNLEYSGLLRRIAWAYGITMTKAIKGILEYSAKYMDPQMVCESCRDRTFCEFCLFKDMKEKPGGEICRS